MARCVGAGALLTALLVGCGPKKANSQGAGGSATKPVALANDARPAGSAAAKWKLPPHDGPVWFTEVTDESGVDFRHRSGDCPEKPFPAANGSGLAAFDYDLDGQPDLYFATGTEFPLDPRRAGPTNRIYRQVGALKFREVTAATGLGHNGYSAGLAVGDYDADGFPDVYISCFGPNVLYHNLGDGTFERVEAGVDDGNWGTSAAWLDYDEDGLVDLYVCNYAKWTWEDNPYCGDRVRKIRMHCGPRSVEPRRHLLYRNRGDGSFEDTLVAAGIGERGGRGQGVVAADIDDDGHVDLYVGNDLHPNFLFLGDGQGTFHDATETSGAAYDSLGTEQASMGVDVADVNADGRFDLFVTNFQHEYNTLYENVGGGFFQDATNRYALVADALPWVGWGAAFIDFDLDGWLDLVVTNGHVDDNRSLFAEDASYSQPPLAYRGSGRRFKYLGAEAGGYFAKPHVGRGLAVVDLDNDGDQDLVIGHQDERPSILRNERVGPGASRAATVMVRLVGTRGNRDAIGATVTFQAGARHRKAPIKGGGSYLSASDPRLVFAVLPDEHQGAIEIRWPGGATSSVVGLEPGQEYVIVEPSQSDVSPAVHRQEFHP